MAGVATPSALTINYYDSADLSKPIATEQRPLKPGVQMVAADDSVVAKVGNYQRTEGYADQQVQVNEDGTIDADAEVK